MLRFMNRETLPDKIKPLPSRVKRRARAFVHVLTGNSMRKGRRQKKSFKFDWAAGVAEMKDQFTAVGLQHSLNDRR